MSVPVLRVDLPVDRRRTGPPNGRRAAAADGRRSPLAERRLSPFAERRRRVHGDRRLHLAVAEVRRSRPAGPEDLDLDLEALLDELVRGLFSLGLGIAGAISQLEGPVADRLSAVLEDADRLVRTVRSAAVAQRNDLD